MWVMTLALVAANVVFIGISLPLVRGQVPRNMLYGFRTPKTMRDDRAWYPANAYGGKAIIVSSAVSIVLELVLALAGALTPGAALNAHAGLFVATALAAFIAPSLAAIAASLLYIRRL